jgi:hypothetical protein
VWVSREIEAWRVGLRPEQVLIALIEGDIEWDETAGDFDWSRSTALNPALAGLFASQPLWVDFRWAQGSEQLSLRNPEFLLAAARLAAPLHGISLEEMVGDDVREHRRTKIVAGGMVTALVAFAFVAGITAVIATRASEDAEQKLALLRTSFPEWEIAGGAPADKGWARLQGKPAEERVDWGPPRLALKSHCDEYANSARDDKRDCPPSRAAFDRNGTRNDIPRLFTALDVLAEAARGGALKNLAGDAILGGSRSESSETYESRRADFASKALVSLEVLYRREHLESIRPARYWMWDHERAPGYFNILSKQVGDGRAELILLKVTHIGFCGSAGCDTVVFGILLVRGKGRLVFLGQGNSEFVLYDTGAANLPQLFTVHALQGGADQQGRYFGRYLFDHNCFCYRRYLQGSIGSSAPLMPNQEIPAVLPTESDLPVR